MKTIPLTQGQVALVDDADFEWLSQFKWCAMHNSLMGEPPTPNLTPDHRDGNGLNNQRGNLRWATKAQQAQNSRVRSDNSSGFRGVKFCGDKPYPRPWQAHIWSGGKYFYLGKFDTPELAAAAYNSAARSLFGEFARLNPVPDFPLDSELLKASLRRDQALPSKK